ncbi:MAG: hypothetical protein SVX43_05950 [Cyanobacteriota bacterium]|nr:hypothetical protein [Cyanobacteriota bacterium]
MTQIADLKIGLAVSDGGDRKPHFQRTANSVSRSRCRQTGVKSGNGALRCANGTLPIEAVRKS